MERHGAPPSPSAQAEAHVNSRLITVTHVGTFDFIDRATAERAGGMRTGRVLMEVYRRTSMEWRIADCVAWVQLDNRTVAGPAMTGVPSGDQFPNCFCVAFDFSKNDYAKIHGLKSKNVHVKMFYGGSMQVSGLHYCDTDVAFFRRACSYLFEVQVNLNPVMIKIQYSLQRSLDLHALCRRFNEIEFQASVARMIDSGPVEVLASFGQTRYNGTKIRISAPGAPAAAVNAFSTGNVMISSSSYAGVERAYAVLMHAVELYGDEVCPGSPTLVGNNDAQDGN